MKKYWTIIKIELSRQFTYRTNILAFIIGNFFELSSQLIIWTAIYKTLDMVKGYTYEEMMTYVIVGWVFMSITTNYGFEKIIARDIHEGTLSNFITKPMSYLRYIIAKASGRVLIALSVVFIESLVAVLIFSKFIVVNISFTGFLVLFVMLVMSYLIKLFLAILIGLIAFWTIDIAGIYNSINIFVKFLSGAYFPVNLLPINLVNISLAFPFIYTFYIPVRFFIGKLSIAQALLGILVQIVWLFILYALIKIIWKIGSKEYESVGI
jgi:ABC-2 type transport system permease protein